MARFRPRIGVGRRLIGWLVAYAFILHAVLAGILATQAAASGSGAGTHFELCPSDPDGSGLPGRTQHENCAVHCAVAGTVPALLLALVAVLFPSVIQRRIFILFSTAHFDLMRRAGLGSRAPPLSA